MARSRSSRSTTPRQPSSPPPTFTPIPDPARIVAGDGGVNVRSGPGTGYVIRGYLAAEEQARVTGRHGDWWRIEHEGSPGCVFGAVVTAFDVDSVPYVMYFYQGYGLHAAPWHNNFGHPMSHGCVNPPVTEAEWPFGFADVGTLVNVHE